jgi:hypothetical protein
MSNISIEVKDLKMVASSGRRIGCVVDKWLSGSCNGPDSDDVVPLPSEKFQE